MSKYPEYTIVHKKECIGYYEDEDETLVGCAHLSINLRCNFFIGCPLCDDLIDADYSTLKGGSSDDHHSG